MVLGEYWSSEREDYNEYYYANYSDYGMSIGHAHASSSYRVRAVRTMY